MIDWDELYSFTEGFAPTITMFLRMKERTRVELFTVEEKIGESFMLSRFKIKKNNHVLKSSKYNVKQLQIKLMLTQVNFVRQDFAVLYFLLPRARER